ncbi:MAG: hypothetical protein ABIR94_15145 [Rubrivivax sp.]
MMKRTLSAVVASLLLFSGCGGGSDISGIVTGLTTAGLTLSDGYETISVAKDATSFVFPTIVDDTKTYNVSVVTQPAGLRCTVANGSGTAASNTDVSNVVVTCAAVFPLSGTVSGLRGIGLVLTNGSEDVGVAATAPSFAFPTALASETSYKVTVKTQPSSQACTVSNGEGTVGRVAVANVAVTCN